MLALINDNGFILLGSSHELIAVALAKTLRKNDKLLAFILFILRCTDFVLQLNELI